MNVPAFSLRIAQAKAPQERHHQSKTNLSKLKQGGSDHQALPPLKAVICLTGQL
jgi:hypothetical protein